MKPVSKKSRLIIITVATLMVLSVFPAYAQVDNFTCSPSGYSVYTVNGVFTNDREATLNKRALEDKLLKTYNNQKLSVDYLLNPSHAGGLGDLLDYVRQGYFDGQSDYDLVEMLNDASGKIKTPASNSRTWLCSISAILKPDVPPAFFHAVRRGKKRGTLARYSL